MTHTLKASAQNSDNSFKLPLWRHLLTSGWFFSIVSWLGSVNYFSMLWGILFDATLTLAPGLRTSLSWLFIPDLLLSFQLLSILWRIVKNQFLTTAITQPSLIISCVCNEIVFKHCRSCDQCLELTPCHWSPMSASQYSVTTPASNITAQRSTEMRTENTGIK